MTVKHTAVEQILADFRIGNAVDFLEEMEDVTPPGFSKEPTVHIVGSVELAREKRRNAELERG